MSDYQEYTQKRKSFWNKTWSTYGNKVGTGSFYHKRLARIYSLNIPEDANIIEVGCGNGKLLKAINCAEKTGIDFSDEAIKLARDNCPEATFEAVEALSYESDKKFDYIILSDLLGDVWDIQILFNHIHKWSHSETKVIVNFYGKLWEGFLKFLQVLRLKKPSLEQNWLTRSDMESLSYLSNYDVVRTWQEILVPVRIPLLNWFLNGFLVKVWFFRHLALSNFMILRVRENLPRTSELVSVIVAARNEEGHIEEIINTLPKVGPATELIFVEGNSTDNTFAKIEAEIPNHPDKNIRLFKQSGKGKGDAVRKGFAEAKGDILMILDADLTVPPEKLPLFYQALIDGKGEFINGVRLVYPMEKEAMRFFNLLGNKFFSWAFSYLLGQKVRDTLCGTKVLWKSDYEKIVSNRSYFGDFDPFGDFDLLFGAAKLNLKIQDLPIRYKERHYGETNISRWRHGFLLLRMTIFASRKIKYV